MIDGKIKKIVIFGIVGALFAFWGVLSFFAPVEKKTEPQIWSAPVQKELTYSPVPRSIVEQIFALLPRQSLCIAPDLTFVEIKSEEGEIPTESKPVPRDVVAEGGGIRLAIIIDDVGLIPSAARRVIALPSAITLSFLPYAPDIQSQTDDAAVAGHEVMLHFPMEPMGRANPGPDALLTGFDDKEIERRIYNNLNAFHGYVGMNNHMGSKFTSDSEKMRFFFDVLKKMGKTDVFFVDSKTAYTTVAQVQAQQAGYRTATRDVFLDDKIEKTAIQGELARLELIGKRNGYAIAIGHPHDLTIEALQAWLPDVQKRGFQIVPVGQLVR